MEVKWDYIGRVKTKMLVPRSIRAVGLMFVLVLLIFVFYFDMSKLLAMGMGIPMFGILFYIRRLEKKTE